VGAQTQYAMCNRRHAVTLGDSRLGRRIESGPRQLQRWTVIYVPARL
jgi:hypothetical protein